jgi:hypothetical protein
MIFIREGADYLEAGLAERDSSDHTAGHGQGDLFSLAR